MVGSPVAASPVLVNGRRLFRVTTLLLNGQLDCNVPEPVGRANMFTC